MKFKSILVATVLVALIVGCDKSNKNGNTESQGTDGVWAMGPATDQGCIDRMVIHDETVDLLLCGPDGKENAAMSTKGLVLEHENGHYQAVNTEETTRDRNSIGKSRVNFVFLPNGDIQSQKFDKTPWVFKKIK